ncbi:LOW QUALITY PROTEIN: X-box-binding protein 1 [Protobothrops mucrosquamatus]|uniref:LOW QUALITY PROTEIN: X-box-binding protein 1 n=1 Tax=Protobothrops mucrosquamatus TaxID=103944 RepID=UPI0010FAF3BB|nr:LOW QUALITY PROTEIN: X-box-binding protein 1 [Protobothrops mucrosquamatus]
MRGSRGGPQAQTAPRTVRAGRFGGPSVVEEEAEAEAAAGMAPLPGPAAPPRLLLLPAASTAPPAAPGAPSPSPPPRKRQRLAHLSPEEKALRRKLKNRVAAQSARDRKKARMGELERQAVELEAENQKLLAENRRLRERAQSLSRENHDLRLRLGLPALKVESQEETASIAPGGAETGSSESAALRLRVPPQQGQAAVFCLHGGGEEEEEEEEGSVGSLPLGTDSLASSDAESDLLLGILDSLDPDMFLHCSSSQATFFEKLQQEMCGEAAVPLPASTSPSLGPAPLKLDAINELIRSDHEYTKPFFLEIISEAATQNGALMEEVVASPPLQAPVSVKEEPADTLLPDLGLSHLLSSDQRPPLLLDAASDSGYEGSPSPFSDLSSPVDTDCSWEEAFAKELFPQLISV